MPSLELVSAADSDLALKAIEAIEKNDSYTLSEIDSVLRYRFQILARRGDYDGRTRLIRSLLRILGSGPAKQAPKANPVQTILARWELMDLLMSAFRKEVDMLEEGKRRYLSRELVRKLLWALELAGETGEAVGSLAARFGKKVPPMSRLLTELEEFEVVERVRSGKNVFVRLGTIGRRLVTPLSEVPPWLEPREFSGAHGPGALPGRQRELIAVR